MMQLRCLLVLICFGLTACQREAPALVAPPVTAPPPQPLPKPAEIERPRYRLFKTQNMWTLLLLDSRTGQLWQTQYDVSGTGARMTVPISQDVLADGEDGRFNLTMTENMWNSILIDTKNGRLWQCQFGQKDDARFCLAIPRSGSNGEKIVPLSDVVAGEERRDTGAK